MRGKSFSGPQAALTVRRAGQAHEWARALLGTRHSVDLLDPIGRARPKPGGVAKMAAHRWVQRSLGLGLVWGLCMAPMLSVHAAVDVSQDGSNEDLRWRTLESEHFILHYPAGLERLADHSIYACERAYIQLAGEFSYRFRQKISVKLHETHDSANGFASYGPQARINLRATAPSSMSTLSSHDDWLQVLITHELAHILHHGAVHGIPKIVDLVLGLGGLGRVWAPSSLMPRWATEGLATYLESEYTSQGRHRSSIHDMMLRAHVLERRFMELDQITSGTRIFPFATGMYLYGSHLITYIAKQYGREALVEMIHDFGSQPIPFGLQRMVQNSLGITLDQLWEEFQADTAARFEAQARRIRSAGLRQGRRLTYTASSGASLQHNRDAVWSQDGQYIYYYGDDGQQKTGLWRISADGPALREGRGFGSEGAQVGAELVVDLPGGTLGSFVGPGEQAMVVSSTGAHDERYSWSDLYLWRASEGENFEQLTFGLRARRPKMAPDGRTVAFVRNDSGQSRIGLLDIETGRHRELEPLADIQQVYDPIWSPDGRYVAYSLWRMGGYRNIVEFDTQTGKTRSWTASRSIDMTPFYSPDGRYLLYASDAGGVFNIYAHDRIEDGLYQVTNVLGGAFQPTLSPDGQTLVYLGFTSLGYDFWRMPFEPSQWTPYSPVPAALSLSMPAPGHASDDFEIRLAVDPRAERNPAPDAQRFKPTVHSQPYRGSEGFFPRTLISSSLDFNSSNFLANINLGGQLRDGIGRHAFDFSVTYLRARKDVSARAEYQFSFGLPAVSLELHRLLYGADGFIRWDRRPDTSSADGAGAEFYRRERYLEENIGGNLQLNLPILDHGRHSLAARMGYGFEVYRNRDYDLVFVDPNAPAIRMPAVGRKGSLSFRLAYSATEGRQFGSGAETGRRSRVEVSVLHRALASDFEGIGFELSHAEFIRMPWRGHHVLALGASGGWASRGLDRFGYFRIGGYGSSQDVLVTILGQGSTGEGGRIRGYPYRVAVARHMAMFNVEYRFPLFELGRGPSSVPLFMRRLRGAVFSDWGAAWNQRLDKEDWYGSIGGTLFFDLMAGYKSGTNISFQYARTLDEDYRATTFQVMVLSSF